MTDLEQLIAQTDKAFDNLREACPYREADDCQNPMIDHKGMLCSIYNCPLLGEENVK